MKVGSSHNKEAPKDLWVGVSLPMTEKARLLCTKNRKGFSTGAMPALLPAFLTKRIILFSGSDACINAVLLVKLVVSSVGVDFKSVVKIQE